jgi:hypothetical protein
MKRNDQFVLEKIEDSIYLLPIGQMIADLNKGIRVNETCQFIWEQLERDISFDELMDKCASHFGAEDEDVECLRKDIEDMIVSLKARGMLEGSRNIFRCGCSLCRNGNPVLAPRFEQYACVSQNAKDTKDREIDTGHYKYVIGGLPVDIYGDDRYLYSSFADFKAESIYINGSEPVDPNADGYESNLAMKVYIIDTTKLTGLDELTDSYFDLEAEKVDLDNNIVSDLNNYADAEAGIPENKKTVLIHHNELTVLEYPTKYILFFHELSGVEELHMSKDGTYAHFFCDKPSDEVRFNLFHAIRMAFLVFALNRGKVMLHSCSILFNDRVWAFSGPSGTGKSTHCEIWKRLFDTPIVNGDLNLLGLEDGIPYVYGTPWCGSSQIYENKKRKLGGIILLKQAFDNRLEELSAEKKVLYVQQRLITSVWDKDSLEKTLRLVSEIVKNIYVKRLYCNKEDEAGYLIHDDIIKSL